MCSDIFKKSKSCGCEQYKPKDIKNVRFGKLVALESTNKRDKNGSVIWECICDCGNKTYVSSKNLIRGSTTNCGCSYVRIKSKKLKTSKNIVGRKFEKLTVIKPIKQKEDGAVIWECKCDCGKITYVRTHNLLNGNTSSCGCLQTEKAKENVEKNFVKYKEKNFIEGTKLDIINNNKLRKDNKIGYKGVYFKKDTGKYFADITFQSKKYYLGTYSKKEDAVKARKETEEKLYDDFLNWYNKKN